MNLAISSFTRGAAIVLGLFAFAIVALAARPSSQASAQEVVPTITITKICVGSDTGTFALNLHTEATSVEEGNLTLDEFLGNIDCGDVTVFDIPGFTAEVNII